MRDGVPKCFDVLARDECHTSSVECARDHHRGALADLLKVSLKREEARFEVEGVDDRFGQDDVDTRFDECFDLSAIRFDHLLERDGAIGGIFHACGDGRLFGRRSDRTGDEARARRIAAGELVASDARAFDSGEVDFANKFVREVELLHADDASAERIRLDDVGTGSEIFPMDLGDVIRAGQTEDIGEASEVLGVVGEAIATHGGFVEVQPLDHRSHGPVEHQHTVF